MRKYGSSWGKPPDGPSAAELSSPDELILQSWAHCKAKKNPLSRFRTDSDEKARRESIKWRKRTSFLELDCGDDAFMVSNTYAVVGVADGVGDWSASGGNSAEVANKLMQNAKLYSETHRGCHDSRMILSEAVKKTLANGEASGGSTTACVAALRQSSAPSPRPSGVLDVLNLGNSSAMLIRNRAMLQRAREKMHGFNAPFQLLVPPRAASAGETYSDSVGDAAHEQWEVEEGDVLVMATDGLFDNVFNSEIATIAGAMGRYDPPKGMWSSIPGVSTVLGSWLGLVQPTDLSLIDPYKITKKLAMMAFDRSYQKDAPTPFSYMLSSFLDTEKLGGKPDDVTVVLSRVVRREELKRVEMH